MGVRCVVSLRWPTGHLMLYAMDGGSPRTIRIFLCGGNSVHASANTVQSSSSRRMYATIFKSGRTATKHASKVDSVTGVHSCCAPCVGLNSVFQNHCAVAPPLFMQSTKERAHASAAFFSSIGLLYARLVCNLSLILAATAAAVLSSRSLLRKKAGEVERFRKRGALRP